MLNTWHCELNLSGTESIGPMETRVLGPTLFSPDVADGFRRDAIFACELGRCARSLGPPQQKNVNSLIRGEPDSFSNWPSPRLRVCGGASRRKVRYGPQNRARIELDGWSAQRTGILCKEHRKMRSQTLSHLARVRWLERLWQLSVCELGSSINWVHWHAASESRQAVDLLRRRPHLFCLTFVELRLCVARLRMPFAAGKATIAEITVNIAEGVNEGDVCPQQLDLVEQGSEGWRLHGRAVHFQNCFGDEREYYYTELLDDMDKRSGCVDNKKNDRAAVTPTPLKAVSIIASILKIYDIFNLNLL